MLNECFASHKIRLVDKLSKQRTSRITKVSRKTNMKVGNIMGQQVKSIGIDHKDADTQLGFIDFCID